MDSVKCRNCGNMGHRLKNCRFPRLSYGIVLFNEKNEVVMIEKHDSISYIEFIRGKYSVDDINYIQLLVDRMSKEEQNKIVKLSFNELWNSIWYSENSSKEYEKSMKKYDKLIELKLLGKIINKSTKKYNYNEWEIPKGRRNLNETNRKCAIREFQEETNIDPSKYDIFDNILPFEECYIGSNNIQYKNIYYIGSLKNKLDLKIDKRNINQLHEVKNIKWLNRDNIEEYVRDYSDYKLNVMYDIFDFLDSNYKKKIIL